MKKPKKVSDTHAAEHWLRVEAEKIIQEALKIETDIDDCALSLVIQHGDPSKSITQQRLQKVLEHRRHEVAIALARSMVAHKAIHRVESLDQAFQENSLPS